MYIIDKDGHIQIEKERFSNGVRHGLNKSFASSILKIRNVTTQDEGKYYCEVTVHSRHKNSATYTLKAYSKVYTFKSYNNYNLLLF